MTTKTETAEVDVTVVENNEDKPRHGEERYNEVLDEKISPSAHREEATTSLEGVKPDSMSAHNTVSGIDSDLEKTTLVETNKRKAGNGETVMVQSVQDTVTTTEVDTTVTQVMYYCIYDS